MYTQTPESEKIKTDLATTLNKEQNITMVTVKEGQQNNTLLIKTFTFKPTTFFLKQQDNLDNYIKNKPQMTLKDVIQDLKDKDQTNNKPQLNDNDFECLQEYNSNTENILFIHEDKKFNSILGYLKKHQQNELCPDNKEFKVYQQQVTTYKETVYNFDPSQRDAYNQKMKEAQLLTQQIKQAYANTTLKQNNNSSFMEYTRSINDNGQYENIDMPSAIKSKSFRNIIFRDKNDKADDQTLELLQQKVNTRKIKSDDQEFISQKQKLQQTLSLTRKTFKLSLKNIKDQSEDKLLKNINMQLANYTYTTDKAPKFNKKIFQEIEKKDLDFKNIITKNNKNKTITLQLNQEYLKDVLAMKNGKEIQKICYSDNAKSEGLDNLPFYIQQNGNDKETFAITTVLHNSHLLASVCKPLEVSKSDIVETIEYKQQKLYLSHKYKDIITTKPLPKENKTPKKEEKKPSITPLRPIKPTRLYDKWYEEFQKKRITQEDKKTDQTNNKAKAFYAGSVPKTAADDNIFLHVDSTTIDYADKKTYAANIDYADEKTYEKILNNVNNEIKKSNVKKHRIFYNRFYGFYDRYLTKRKERGDSEYRFPNIGKLYYGAKLDNTKVLSGNNKSNSK